MNHVYSIILVIVLITTLGLSMGLNLNLEKNQENSKLKLSKPVYKQNEITSSLKLLFEEYIENRYLSKSKEEQMIKLLKDYYPAKDLSNLDQVRSAIKEYINSHSKRDISILRFVPNHKFVRNKDKQPLNQPVCYKSKDFNVTFVTKSQNLAKVISFPLAINQTSPSFVKLYFFLKKKFIYSTDSIDVSHNSFRQIFDNVVPFDQVILEILNSSKETTCIQPDFLKIEGPFQLI